MTKINIKILILWALITVISFVPVQASKYLIHTYTAEDGMPSSMIGAVTQDKDGLIWACTDRGICTYDGKNWNSMLSGINHKDLTNIVKISIDEKNNIWGLNISNEISLINLNKNSKPLPGYRLNSLELLKTKSYSRLHLNYTNSRLTAAVAIGDLGVLVWNGSFWKLFNTTNGLPSVAYLSVYTVADEVFIGTEKGLFKIKNGIVSSEISVTYFKTPQQIMAVSGELLNGKFRLWLLTNTTAGYIDNNKFIPVVNNLKLYFNAKKRYYSFIPNYFKSIVIANVLEVTSIDTETKIQTTLNKNSGLIDNGCSELFLDREKLLWLSSYRGLSKISSLRFENIAEIDGLLDDEVTSIIEQGKDKFVIGHNTGISYFDYISKDITSVRFKNPTGDERIINMVIDGNKNVWVAASQNGVAKIDKNHKVTWLSAKSLGLPSVMSIAIDSIGRILITDNTNIYELKSGKAKLIYSPNLQGVIIRGLFVTKKNKIYATTFGHGVFILNGDKAINIKSNINENENNVYGFFEDWDSSILIGTEAGLAKIVSNKIVRVDSTNKYLNRYIYFITKDSKGTYWFGTDNGIVRKDSISIWYYGAKDGLAGLETNRGATIINQDGRLMIGTNRGLSIYIKEYDIERNIPPIAQLTSVEVNGKEISIASAPKLGYDQNNLIFNFNVVSFYDEDRNSIQYKLEPFDGDWIDLHNIDNFNVRYNNLAPGNYRFRIRAINALGVESKEVSSPEIIIKDEWFKQYWFVIIFVLILLACVELMRRANKSKIISDKFETEVNLRTAQLANSERRYKQMFSNNNAIMLLIDPEATTIIDANPAAVEYFDMEKSELLKMGLLDFPSSKTFDRLRIIHAINNCEEIEVDYISLKTNEQRQLKAHLSKIENEDKKEVIYCIVNDITEQKIAEQELKIFTEELEDRVQERTRELEEVMGTLHMEISNRVEAEEGLVSAKNELEQSLEREKELSKLKSRFILMISHEYRTPLTVIFSAAELIKEFIKMGHYDTCLEYSKRIQDSVKTLTELLEGVMAIGEDSEVKVFKENFVFNDFLKYIIDEIVNRTNITHNLRVNFLDEGTKICQDRNLLKQVLNQIISNAQKFSEKGSDIIISNSLKKDRLVIRIQDFGFGIADKDIEQIFEPFYKCSDAIGIVAGTGLGLSIAKKNVEAIGGEIYAESELGKGTSIFIEIPTIKK